MLSLRAESPRTCEAPPSIFECNLKIFSPPLWRTLRRCVFWVAQHCLVEFKGRAARYFRTKLQRPASFAASLCFTDLILLLGCSLLDLPVSLPFLPPSLLLSSSFSFSSFAFSFFSSSLTAPVSVCDAATWPRCQYRHFEIVYSSAHFRPDIIGIGKSCRWNSFIHQDLGSFRRFDSSILSLRHVTYARLESFLSEDRFRKCSNFSSFSSFLTFSIV